MNAENVLIALRSLGERVAFEWQAERGRRAPDRSIRVVIAGGAAGLLAGMFRASCATVDCDVPSRIEDERTQQLLERAAAAVAERLELSDEWLSFRCRVFVSEWLLGWEGRCERVAGDFGPLEVARLSRIDLIVSKVMAASRRPQDREDLRDLSPTDAEWSTVLLHLDRVEAEHLDRKEFDTERALVSALRSRR